MNDEVLYNRPELMILAVILAVMLLAGETGFRIGRRQSASLSDFARTQFGTIETALLGLLALLLGFSFSMALHRFELRREIVVKESNAIGTAALRVSLLPPASRPEASTLFRRYVALRLEATSRAGLRTTEVETIDQNAAAVQNRLWAIAAAAAEADPRSVSAGQFISAMNDVIDVKGERDQILVDHVPEAVIFLLIAISIVSVGIVGFVNGLGGARAAGTTSTISILIAIVIFVILDLDRPVRGFINVSQRSMVELAKSISGSE